jgi:glucose/arabinose dehydrogenase
VVGLDNFQFGWLARHPDFHDVPCRDVVLEGRNYATHNPLTPEEGDSAVTGAYVPFGTRTDSGQVIPGRLPCSGAIFRLPLEGGIPELVAWGFRNPFGLAFSPDGRLFAADNGYDVRGSRPAWGTADLLWEVKEGAWHGWPDFSRSGRFGHAGEAFVAQFGDMAPNVGKVAEPVGYRVVRVDVERGTIRTFATNRQGDGPAHRLGGGGLERPVSVRFSPDGESLYVVDFGILIAEGEGTRPYQGTGVIWKVTREAAP